MICQFPFPAGFSHVLFSPQHMPVFYQIKTPASRASIEFLIKKTQQPGQNKNTTPHSLGGNSSNLLYNHNTILSHFTVKKKQNKNARVFFVFFPTVHFQKTTQTISNFKHCTYRDPAEHFQYQYLLDRWRFLKVYRLRHSHLRQVKKNIP